MEHNTITEEQRARAERNRQAALAKKRKRGQPAPPAASGAAAPADSPKMSREEYASICRMFGTQPSQASQASQPSQDGDAWPTSCVDVTEDEPPRAEAPPRDDDRAAPARDGREAAPAREDDSVGATPAGVDPVRVDRVDDDEEAVDLLVGAHDFLTYDEARTAIALIRAAADAGSGPSVNALPVLYHVAKKVSPERLLEICETCAAEIIDLQLTSGNCRDLPAQLQLTERFNELVAGPESDDENDASDAPDDASDGDDANAFFGAVPLSQDDAALLSQRPHDAESLSQYAVPEDRRGIVAPPVQLTGFNTSEVAAGQREAIVAMQQKLAAAAASREEELRERRAPVPAVHFSGSARAIELFKAAEWLPPPPAQDKLLTRDVLQFIGELPQLNPQLESVLNVVDITDWRAHTRFADGLKKRCLTVPTARAMGLKCVTGATLVVSSDQIGRRRTNKERPRDEPAVRIIAVFLDESVAALREAFGEPEQQLSVRRQADAAICYGSSSVRATVKDHQGDMRGEGVRRMQTGLSNGNKHPLHTYAHKKGSGWERDRTYAADVVLNCSKLSWLEGHVAPRLARYRLETRKAVGLPGLAHALGDAMSAPAYFISRGYGSPMHLDKTATCFPEATLCAETKFHRVDLPSTPSTRRSRRRSCGSRASTTSTGSSPCRRLRSSSRSTARGPASASCRPPTSSTGRCTRRAAPTTASASPRSRGPSCPRRRRGPR